MWENMVLYVPPLIDSETNIQLFYDVDLKENCTIGVSQTTLL